MGVAFCAIADVVDEVRLHRACENLKVQLGGCDIVVANAGYGEPESLSRYVPGRAAAMYRTNLMGMLHLVDWALPQFLESEGGARGGDRFRGLLFWPSWFFFILRQQSGHASTSPRFESFHPTPRHCGEHNLSGVRRE